MVLTPLTSDRMIISCAVAGVKANYARYSNYARIRYIDECAGVWNRCPKRASGKECDEKSLKLHIVRPNDTPVVRPRTRGCIWIKR